MIVYISGTNAYVDNVKRAYEAGFRDFSILESFAYVNRKTTELIPLCKNYMLDSGAFTFRKKNNDINWDEFIVKYGNYVKEHNIKYYLELDIDNLVGYDKNATFNAFEIYQDNIHDIDVERKLFGDKKRIGKLYTFNTPMKQDWKFFGNFFYNPKVMLVKCLSNRFVFERFKSKPTTRRFVVDGVEILCTE